MNTFQYFSMFQKTYRLLYCWTFFFFFISVYADTRRECEEFIDKGKIEKQNRNYSKALEYFTKAETLASKNNWKTQLIVAKTNIGGIYKDLSNYNEALHHYNEALSIMQNADTLSEQKLVILNNIGILYHNLQDYDSALKFYKEAYPIAIEKKLNYSATLLAINISDIYNKIGETKEARIYLEQVKNIPKSRMFDQVWRINYAESFYNEGNIKKAKKIVEGLINEIQSNDRDCYTCLVGLLSKIYTEENKIDLAISFAEKGMKNASELKDKIELYEQLSNLYSEKKEYKIALKYKDSLMFSKDSLTTLINRSLFQTNKVNLEVKGFQEALMITEERHRWERNIYISFIGFGSILVFSVYRAFRNRLIREKRERILIENNDKIAKLELQKLKSSIIEKNKKLSMKALYLTGRNELIQQVIACLNDIPGLIQDKSVANYVRILRSYLKTDEEWDEFIEHFEKVNPDFINILKEKHPNLSSNDIRFISYIYMGINIKEISKIFNITYNASRIRQKRIIDKMGLEKDTLLFDYIMKL